MSLVRRRIDLRFQLGEGSFGESGTNTVTVSGLRSSANVSKAGGVGMSHLDLRVYGLTPTLMNRLSTLGKPLIDGRSNIVTVEAGDDDAGMSVVFVGIIAEAWADYQGMPEVEFIVSANTGLLDALKPVPPSSYQGSVDVAVVLSELASQMGYTFENNGVSVQLSNPYFPGTARQQAYLAAQSAGVNLIIDDGVLAIWPINGTRGGQVPEISPETGMVGYPTHTQNGIALTSLYNPNVVPGGQVSVSSRVTPANGVWAVFNVSHELEAETPGGRWFTHMECSVLGRPTPLAR